MNGSSSFIGEYKKFIETIDKLDPVKSVLRKACTQEWRDAIRNDIEQCTCSSRSHINAAEIKLPPLYTHIVSLDNAHTVDACLTRISTHPRGSSIAEEFVQLGMKRRDDGWTLKDRRDWIGRLFEVAVFSVLARHFAPGELEFEPLLPNGRKSDVRLLIAGRHVQIELTTLNVGDGQMPGLQKWLTHDSGGRIWDLPPRCRSGESEWRKAPELSHSQARLYCKIYDKAAPSLDSQRSQFSKSEPNVLFVSGDFLARLPDTLVRHALNEVLRVPPSQHHEAWMRSRVMELVNEENKSKRCCDTSQSEVTAAIQEMVSGCQRIGAIMFFRGRKLIVALRNTESHTQCALAEAELAGLEQIFRDGLPW